MLLPVMIKKMYEMTFTNLFYLFKNSAHAAALFYYPYKLSGLSRALLRFIPITFLETAV